MLFCSNFINIVFCKQNIPDFDIYFKIEITFRCLLQCLSINMLIYAGLTVIFTRSIRLLAIFTHFIA
jgi:hypothetical protein